MNAVALSRRTPARAGTDLPTLDVAADLVPLVPRDGSTPAVTIVVATRPGPQLASGDVRRLQRMVGALDRRLAGLDPGTARRTLRRIARLARFARALPARNGLVLVASETDSAVVHLTQPVCDRVLVGPAPSRLEVLEQTWSPGAVAVLLVSRRGARLLVSELGSLDEPARARPRLHPVPSVPDPPHPADPGGPASVVDEAGRLVQRHLPPHVPLVVAGDPGLAAAVTRSAPVRDRAPAVLAGDHSASAPATVAALAERALRRGLDAEQRSAMVSLALAVEAGRVVAGLSEVLCTTPRPDDLLVVERGLLAAARPTQGRDDRTAPTEGVEPDRPAPLDEWTAHGLGRLVDDVASARGRTVAVPDGSLVLHDRIALAPDHRARVGDAGRSGS